MAADPLVVAEFRSGSLCHSKRSALPTHRTAQRSQFFTSELAVEEQEVNFFKEARNK
jgi:hypothetical protein